MRRAETVEKAYGGIRTRHIAMLGISSLLDDNWSGIRLILRIERRRELKGSCQKPMTPLPCSNWPDPTGKIACFTIGDGTRAEDACRVGTENAPIALGYIPIKYVAI